ncbi:MAG TPA: type IV toxin-antitoxin system AbiEi family antitoxin domain-containing protein [Chthoniobacterales bacterium]
MTTAIPNAIQKAFKKSSVLRSRDLESHGIWRATLGQLVKKGVIVRVGRGLYTLTEGEVGENHTLAEAGKRIPNGIVCLLSALRFHGLTTQQPHEVWLALDGKAREPRVDHIPLRIVRSSGEALHAGQEEHLIEGVAVKIYCPAKTVADCFKFRNKIGLDVALEALRETWREKGCTMDDLTRYARICRVGNVMRPYLESLT